MKFNVDNRIYRVKKYKERPSYTYYYDSENLTIVTPDGQKEVVELYEPNEFYGRAKRLAFKFNGIWYAIESDYWTRNTKTWYQVKEKPRKEYKRAPVKRKLRELYVNCRADREKSVKGARETNDCTVLSLARAMSIPYDDAHSLMERAGRKNRKGIPMAIALKNAAVLRDKFEEVVTKRRITVATFAKNFQEGRYIVLTNRHAQSVIDGKIYDNLSFGPMRRVITAFRYKEEAR